MGSLCHARQFRDQPETALIEVAQAGGRTAATLTGTLLDAHLGEGAWPAGWSSRHNLAALTLMLADDLFTRVKSDSLTLDEDWWARHPGYWKEG